MTIQKKPALHAPTPVRTSPKPISAPAPTRPPPRLTTKDELSVGKGRALRTKAVGGAVAQTAVEELRALRAASLRGTAATALNATSSTSAATAVTASPEVQRKAEENLSMVRDAGGLSYALEREQDPAVRNEMIRQVMNSENADQLLTSNFGGNATTNQDYDQTHTVASAIDDAVRAGAVTQADVNKAVEHMEPESAALFIGSLSIEGNNRALGGAVEMFGIAAKNQGYEQAAALAFTSSDSLIDKYYPTAAEQKKAFEQVNSYIEDWDDALAGQDDMNGVARNALEFAVGSAARLTARGNGYGPGELEAELEEMGPRFTQETIARLGEATRFDGRVPGAIDTLSDAAQAVADKGGKKADDFAVAAALGYTQTPQLISENLKTPEQRRAALEALNGFLAERRDQFGDAANGDPPYSLLRDPQAIEGINNLLGQDPTLLRSLVDGGPQGEATLVQLMESISLNPDVPQELRDQFQGRVDGLLRDVMADATKNPNESGATIGRLLGLIQVAGNRAVEAAGDEDQSQQNAVRDLAKDVTSGIVGLALSSTGPVGSIVGGAVMNQVLDAIFDTPPGPTSQQIRAAFADQLAKAGIDVSSGEIGFDQLQSVLGKTLDALNNVKPLTPELQDQINRLEQLKDSMDSTFGGSIDSDGGAGGSLATELDKRDDKP